MHKIFKKVMIRGGTLAEWQNLCLACREPRPGSTPGSTSSEKGPERGDGKALKQRAWSSTGQPSRPHWPWWTQHLICTSQRQVFILLTAILAAQRWPKKCNIVKKELTQDIKEIQLSFKMKNKAYLLLIILNLRNKELPLPAPPNQGQLNHHLHKFIRRIFDYHEKARS